MAGKVRARSLHSPQGLGGEDSAELVLHPNSR